MTCPRFILVLALSALTSGLHAQFANWTLNPKKDATYTAGNVGIGTNTPDGRFHLIDPAASVTQIIETGGGTNAWAQTRYRNPGGQWVIGTSRNFNGDVFYMDRLGNASIEFQLSPTGSLGLGVTPQTKLHLFEPAVSVSHRIETGAGTNAWTRLEFANGDGQWNVGTSRNFNGNQFYVARQGSNEIAFAIQPNGDAFVNRNLTTRSLTIRGGADVAEPFQMGEAELEKGSVVVIDEANPGHLKCSAQPYDTRVAGIISGANGVNPGIALHQEGMIEGGQNVALSGRVFVRAETSGGAIKPGDLLTTSALPGYAMKVSDPSRAPGAVLGKAMSALSEKTGLVLVLVTLQ